MPVGAFAVAGALWLLYLILSWSAFRHTLFSVLLAAVVTASVLRTRLVKRMLYGLGLQVYARLSPLEHSLATLNQQQQDYPETRDVAAAFDRLLDLVQRDFIEYWFKPLSNDTLFPAHLAALLRQLVQKGMEHARCLDRDATLQHILAIVSRHLKLFAVVRTQEPDATTAHAQSVEHILQELKLRVQACRDVNSSGLDQDGPVESDDTGLNLVHPACISDAAFHAHLRKLAAGIVHWYGPLPEVNSQVTRALMVEIIAGSILRPTVETLSDPHTLHTLMCAVLEPIVAPQVAEFSQDTTRSTTPTSSSDDVNDTTVHASHAPPDSDMSHALESDADADPDSSTDELDTLLPGTSRPVSANAATRAPIVKNGALIPEDSTQGLADQGQTQPQPGDSPFSSKEGVSQGAQVPASDSNLADRDAPGYDWSQFQRRESSASVAGTHKFGATVDARPCFAASVTGTVHVQSHIEFTIEVWSASRPGRNDAGDGTGWVVQRRFSEFKRLHTFLKRKYPVAMRTVHLPRHSTIMAPSAPHTERSIEARRAALDTYFQNVIGKANLGGVFHVVDFVSPNSIDFTDKDRAFEPTALYRIGNASIRTVFSLAKKAIQPFQMPFQAVMKRLTPSAASAPIPTEFRLVRRFHDTSHPCFPFEKALQDLPPMTVGLYRCRMEQLTSEQKSRSGSIVAGVYPSRSTTANQGKMASGERQQRQSGQSSATSQSDDVDASRRYGQRGQSRLDSVVSEEEIEEEQSNGSSAPAKHSSNKARLDSFGASTTHDDSSDSDHDRAEDAGSDVDLDESDSGSDSEEFVSGDEEAAGWSGDMNDVGNAELGARPSPNQPGHMASCNQNRLTRLFSASRLAMLWCRSHVVFSFSILRSLLTGQVPPAETILSSATRVDGPAETSVWPTAKHRVGYAELCFELASNIFELKGAYLVTLARTPLVWPAVSANVERFMEELCLLALNETTVTTSVDAVREALWPNGEFLSETVEPAAQQKEETRIRAYDLMSALLPRFAVTILGESRHLAGVDVLMECIEHPELNRMLVMHLLDLAFASLTPDSTE